MEQIRVIIADDHDLYRDGLRLLFSKNNEIELVGEARDGEELIRFARTLKPDVIVTDLIMPKISGIEAIKELHSSGTSLRNIALSTFDSEHLIVEALEAGASGYIIKNAQRGEIIDAIKTVYEGQPYYCTSTSAHLTRLISESKYNPYTKTKKEEFSDIEIAIICLVCDGKTSEEISQELLLGKRNVEAIRSRIMIRMNAKSAIDMVMYAIKNKIYKIKE